MLRFVSCIIFYSFTALVLSGCATAPGPTKDFEAPVYPSPPDEPRFHYERTILSSADVLQEEDEAALRRLLTGEQRTGIGMGKPFSVAVHQGRIFVSDTQRRSVMVFDAREHKFFELGVKKPGVLGKPLGLDVDESGNIYVCDGSARVIQVYDRDGNHLRTLGQRELFSRPTGVAVDPKISRLYVVDTGGVSSDQHHILVFDLDSGDHLFNISKRGSADGELNLPREIAIAADGTLYVIDGGNFRVQVFKPDGSFVKAIGDIGRRTGQFSRPKGIDLDADGNIYVSDAAFGNFQIFNPDGQLLLNVGERGADGSPGTFMLPAGLAVDEDGRIYMVDQFMKKIEIFRPHTVGADEGYLGTDIANLRNN